MICYDRFLIFDLACWLLNLSEPVISSTGPRTSWFLHHRRPGVWSSEVFRFRRFWRFRSPQENLGEPAIFQSFSQELGTAELWKSGVVTFGKPQSWDYRHGTSLAFFCTAWCFGSFYFYFSILIVIPSDELHHFQRGRCSPPTSIDGLGGWASGEVEHGVLGVLYPHQPPDRSYDSYDSYDQPDFLVSAVNTSVQHIRILFQNNLQL